MKKLSLLILLIIPILAIGQTISGPYGPSSSALGSTHTYSVYGDYPILMPEWGLSGGGIILSTSSQYDPNESTYTYSASIQWNVLGTHSVNFLNGGNLVSQKEVDVLMINSWFEDFDQDGYGNNSVTISANAQPFGYVLDNTDCNDSDPTIHPLTKWYEDADGDGFGSLLTIITSCTQPSGYVLNSNDQCISTPGTEFGCPPISALSLTSTSNYVLSRTLREAVQASTYDPNNSSLEVTDQISYFDGLGRVEQRTIVKQSGSLKDLCIIQDYDIYGRPNKEYLPYTSALSGSLDPSPIANQTSFYQASIQGKESTSMPFAETKYEQSPSSRILKKGSPGEDTQPTTAFLGDATTKIDYTIPIANELTRWVIEDDQLKLGDSYPQGSLVKQSVYDEDDKLTETFTDSKGQTVLKRPSIEGDWAQTHYVYDVLGRLRVVLPPEASAQMDSFFDALTVDGYTILDEDHTFPQGTYNGKYAYMPNVSVTIPSNVTLGADFELIVIRVLQQEFLDTWAFQYQYDDRNRMISKKVPGADPVKMVYDKWDRLVLTQDGNQRIKKEWAFTKYDVVNRPIMAGIFIIDGEIGADEVSVRNFVANSANRSETYDGSGTYGYTNVTYPNDPADFLTVTYYDNYSFKSLWTENMDFDDPSSPSMIENADVKGQVTGSMTKYGTSWIKSATYYDEKYRPIQTQSTNHLGGIDIVTNYFDFIGQVDKTISSHYDGNKTTEITRRYEYDHAGRLIDTFHELSNDLLWTDMVGVSASGNNLTKTNANNYGNGGAASTQRLANGQNGYIEVTAKTNSRVLVGFSEENTNAHFNTIDYCVYLSPSWTLTAYENGSNKGGLGTYSEGDVIRVERNNDNIMIKKNGITIYSSSLLSTSTLIADVALYYTGDQINDAKFAVGSILLAHNEYNELGELKEKNLHSDSPLQGGSGGVFAQSVNYTYNIRGWLTDINDPAVTDDTHLFGMKLHYNENPLDPSNTHFNGNISAMKWSNNDTDGGTAISTRAYNYSYDALNRLTNADHIENSNNANFDVSGFEYDLNGNIKRLVRKGDAGANMDNLTYNYEGNRLLAVADSGNDEGFKDGNTSGDDYEYDDNGNMTVDKNKGIISIEYNHLNLPTTVILSNSEGSGRIEYLYDAAGIKLQQKVFENNTLTKTTDYVGEFIYEDGVLQLIQQEEGRIVPKWNVAGTAIEKYDYQYHLKDHLGNVRVTFSTTHEFYNRTATFEDNKQATESLEFGNVTANREDHPLVSNTGKAARLNNAAPAGPYAVLSVNKGDTVHLSAKGYYNGGSGYSNAIPAGTFETFLQDAVNTSQTLLEGGASVASINNGIAAAIASIGVGGSSSNSVPGAYLNYLIFDREMNYQGIAGYTQISSAANGSEQLIERNDILIDREGYLIAYLSNESNTSNYVYFDDFTVYHGKTNIVSTDDYYPFGLTFNSYERTASTKNFMNTFQDQEYEEETGWVKFKWRNHQPDIGRFFNVDPLTEDYVHNSPYAFSENKVIDHVELEGLEGVRYDEVNFLNGVEMNRTHVVELDVHVAVTSQSGNSHYTSSDLPTIQSNLNAEYSGQTSAGGNPMEFRFNMQSFNVDQTSASSFESSLVRNPNNYVSDVNGVSRPKGIVLQRQSIPPVTRNGQTGYVQGRSIGNPNKPLVTINSSAFNSSHTQAHEALHRLIIFGGNSVNPSTVSSHNSAGGLFSYGSVNSSGVVSGTNNISQGNVNSIMTNTPQTADRPIYENTITEDQLKGGY